MEDIWKDPSDLSKFIDHPIPIMHENIYYPERGTSRPEIQGLRDQWGSDLQDLSIIHPFYNAVYELDFF